MLVIPLIILNFVMPPEKEETYSNLAFAIYSVALKPRKFHKQYTG